MASSIHLRLFWTPLALSFVLGCTVGKKDVRTPHESKVQSQGDKSDSESNHPAAHLIDEAQILNLENLNNPEFRAERNLIASLGKMNTDLIESYKRYPGSENIRQRLDKYRRALLANCQSETLKSCKNLEVFKNDSQSVSIVKILAKNTSDLDQFYLLIQLGYELQNGHDDLELANLTVSRLIEWLTRDFSGRHGLSQSHRSRMLTLFANVFQSHPSIKIDSRNLTQVFDWIASGQIESRTTVELNSFLGSQIAREITSDHLWSRFIQLIERESNNSNSYRSMVERISKQDPDAFKSFDVELIDIAQLIKDRSTNLAYLMYLERIANLRPSSRELFWIRFVPPQPEFALKMIRSYLRVSLIDRMQYTHRAMAKFFNDFMVNGDASAGLLSEAVKYSSNRLTPSWNDYHGQIRAIETQFLDLFEKKYITEASPLGDLAREIRKTFDQFNPAVSYMVTYPNMLMLGYFAAKANLTYTISTRFGTKIEINKNLIVHEFLEGRAPPLFLYTAYQGSEASRNRESVNSVEILWALYYLFKAKVPQVYGVTEEEFLKVFFATYKDRIDSQLRKLNDRFTLLMKPGNGISTLMRYCSTGRLGKKLLDSTVSVQTLPYHTFLGDFDRTTPPPMNSGLLIYHLIEGEEQKNSLDEAIEVLRSEVRPALDRLRMIQKLLPESAKSALAEANRQLEESENLRSLTLTNIRILIDDLPQCMMDLRDIEMERQKHLVLMEKAFLEKIELVLKISAGLDARNNPESIVRALGAADSFFGSLDPTDSLSSSLNRLFAEKSHMHRAFQIIRDYERSYYNDAGFKIDSFGRLRFVYRHMDRVVRLLHFTKYGFNSQNIPTSFDNIRLVYPETLRALQDATKSSSSSFGHQIDLTYNPKLSAARTGLMDFISKFNWINKNGGPIKTMRSFLKSRAALIKYDWLSDQMSPTERKSQLISALELNRRFFDDFNLLQEDEDFLADFSTHSYIDIKNAGHSTGSLGPELLFWDNDPNGTVNGFGDELFIYLSSKLLGYPPRFRELRVASENSWGPPPGEQEAKLKQAHLIKSETLIQRADPFELAEHIYDILFKQNEVLVFPVDEASKSAIEEMHSRLVRTDLQIAESFVQTTREWLSENPLPLTRYSLRVGPQKTPDFNETMLGVYRAQIREFNIKTRSVFAPQKLR